MNTRELTARGRILGAELRAWRERANLEGAEVARRLSWSPTKVCNIEAGRRSVTEVDAAMYLACCRAPGDDIQQILEFFHEQHEYWVQPHGDQLSDKLISLITLESTASVIKSFVSSVIHGLLQTEDYVRALITGAGLAPSQAIEPRVRARKDRQVVLRRQIPAKCVFFVHENALRMPVGNDAIMNDQMLHLVFISARPHIDIRVVPAAAGPHAGLGGPFTLFESPGAKRAVYLEHDVASLIVDSKDCVDWYRDVLANLADVALSEGESRSWLADLASEYDRPREDHDEPARGEGAPLA